MKKKITVSVGNLVDYSSRSGDLSFDSFSQSNPREAILAHQKIQKSRPGEYTGEVPISYQFEIENYLLEVNGRMDGIYRYPDRIVIEEIKTTTKDIDAVIKNPNPGHWAQLKIYCYICTLLEGKDEIEGQLVYFQLESEEIEEIKAHFTKKELELFFDEFISRYIKRIETIDKWLTLRDRSIKELEFPFKEYRPGQRGMAVEVYAAIKNEKEVLIQAATGIGKTMSTIFPAVKAMGEDLSSKTFFLTARTTGKEAAETAIGEMRKKGLRIKSLTLTAKDKICFKKESACSPEECEFARGYFDRVDEAVESFFREDSFSRTEIENKARHFKVCPFEFSLELSLMADVIICDYNYAFDPRVYLKRFFLEDNRDYILLIDEAHNLVERSREMFSAEISKQDFLDTRRLLKKKLPGLFKKIGKVNSRMLKYRKNCDEKGSFIAEEVSPEDITPILRSFLRSSENWLVRNIASEFRESLMELYFKVRAFVRILEEYDDNYRTIYERDGKDLRLKLFCIDPSTCLKSALKKIRSAVFFSATMSPQHYFKSLFGCGEDSRTIDIPSPFPPENLCLVIFEGISTLYKHREKTKGSAASLVDPIVKSKKGNYLIFFPSYAYMNMILGAYDSDKSGYETIIQNPGMSEDERDDFLNSFSRDNKGTLVGFAVMGGVFGEGIDLEGERLSGAVIYGVGLPGISPERDIIRDFFNRKDNTGFEYAYLYPGINRVLQAAGRVIRSEKDRGAVILIDDRYKSYRYKSLLPAGWQPVTMNKSRDVNKVLTDFWEGQIN
ncbi:ATP-dependent DNA helicase [Thermodesulfobacteriota bacterium]